MTIRWAATPCSKYWEADDIAVCVVCGWNRHDHEMKNRYQEKTMTELSETPVPTSAAKLDQILQLLAELTEKVEGLGEANAEIVEKLSNLTLETDGFRVFDE